MKEQLEQILSAVRQSRPAALALEAKGEFYTRRFQPRERLILLGGGHIAFHLHTMAARLGFAVTVVDDRAAFASPQRFPESEQTLVMDFSEAIQCLHIGPGDYVAIMTRGHRYDADCLRALLSEANWPRYVGMVASRRRGITLLGQLRKEGFDSGRLEQIHTPIGLAINAMTLEEIGVSIAAELVQVRRAECPRRSHSTQLTQTEPEENLLRFAVEDPEPKAMVVVLETRGSTPVKTGALLVLDQNLRTAGTIGGGCAESSCVRQAWRLIGTGAQEVFTVSLNDEEAEEQGMACGGTMKVLAVDLSTR